MLMEIPNTFYTAATLFSLSGSSTAVLIITSVVGYLLEPRESKNIKKWLGLLLSILLALLGATYLEEKGILTWVIATINGFLIYLTAVGANTIIGHAAGSNESTQAPIRETSAVNRRRRSRFTELWW